MKKRPIDRRRGARALCGAPPDGHGGRNGNDIARRLGHRQLAEYRIKSRICGPIQTPFRPHALSTYDRPRENS